MKLRSHLLGSVAALAAVWAGACARPAATTPSKEEQAAVAVVRGKSVYDTLCGPCHDADDLHLIQTPPKLDGLFSKQKLLNGAPVTDQAVRDVILHGGGIMPPFEHSLTSNDIDALIQYLHTR